MDHIWNWDHGAPMGVFGFIIIIVLINAVASVFRTRAKQDVIREAMRSGKDVDPELLKSFQDSESEGGNGIAGLILMAIAVGLVFMGYQIGKVEPDEPVFDILLGVASIPFLIGVVLLLSAAFTSNKRK